MQIGMTLLPKTARTFGKSNDVHTYTTAHPHVFYQNHAARSPHLRHGDPGGSSIAFPRWHCNLGCNMGSTMEDRPSGCAIGYPTLELDADHFSS